MAQARKRKTRESRALVNETPEQKFQRLATARVNIAIKRISLIANLAGPGYISTDEQKKKIIDALFAACGVVEKKFAGTKDKTEAFTL